MRRCWRGLRRNVSAIAFQHGPGNELLGLDSRAALLRRLGEVCAAHPERFGTPARPGHLFDYWRAQGEELPAAEILRTLLVALGPIWPNRLSLGGVALGDCGRHSAVPGDGIVPFHKLSQWLAYSLVEPLQAGGLRVTGLDGLTGLAEYRNGGLLLDCGVIVPRDEDLLAPSARPGQRARGRVAGLDRGLARPPGASRCGNGSAKTPRSFRSPACLKAAVGRRAAKSPSRAGLTGSAPINIVSDGTLF